MVSTIDQASAAIGGPTETPTSFMQITDTKGQAPGGRTEEDDDDECSTCGTSNIIKRSPPALTGPLRFLGFCACSKATSAWTAPTSAEPRLSSKANRAERAEPKLCKARLKAISQEATATACHSLPGDRSAADPGMVARHIFGFGTVTH